jgi:hypothetical protein
LKQAFPVSGPYPDDLRPDITKLDPTARFSKLLYAAILPDVNLNLSPLAPIEERQFSRWLLSCQAGCEMVQEMDLQVCAETASHGEWFWKLFPNLRTISLTVPVANVSARLAESMRFLCQRVVIKDLVIMGQAENFERYPLPTIGVVCRHVLYPFQPFKVERVTFRSLRLYPSPNEIRHATVSAPHLVFDRSDLQLLDQGSTMAVFNAVGPVSTFGLFDAQFALNALKEMDSVTKMELRLNNIPRMHDIILFNTLGALTCLTELVLAPVWLEPTQWRPLLARLPPSIQKFSLTVHQSAQDDWFTRIFHGTTLIDGRIQPVLTALLENGWLPRLKKLMFEHWLDDERALPDFDAVCAFRGIDATCVVLGEEESSDDEE